MKRTQPITAAAIAVAVALVVAAAWCGRSRTPVALSAVDGTVSVRVTRHDSFGMPSAPPEVVRERTRVHAIVEALGVDGHPVMTCPADYASAEVGLLLNGRDIYARRNVYVWDLSKSDANALVVTVDSTGCRGGPPLDAGRLRAALEPADAGSHFDGGNKSK